MTFKGKKLSKQHIEILRLTNSGNKYCVGRVQSEATRAKISKAMKGHFVSIETRRRMRLALLNRFGKNKNKKQRKTK